MEVPPYLTGILIVLLCSAFVKCLTTFSILRYGLGLHGAGFGLVLIALSLGLTLFALAPQVEQLGGVAGLFSANPPKLERIQERFTPLLEKQTDPALRDSFSALAVRLRSSSGAAGELGAESRFSVLAAAYLVSEVSEAFRLGFMLLIPFLVIDLLVTNVLLLLGAVQISQAVIALPLKILLFFALNGWALLTEKLIGSYV